MAPPVPSFSASACEHKSVLGMDSPNRTFGSAAAKIKQLVATSHKYVCTERADYSRIIAILQNGQIVGQLQSHYSSIIMSDPKH